MHASPLFAFRQPCAKFRILRLLRNSPTLELPPRLASLSPPSSTPLVRLPDRHPISWLDPPAQLSPPPPTWACECATCAYVRDVVGASPLPPHTYPPHPHHLCHSPCPAQTHSSDASPSTTCTSPTPILPSTPSSSPTTDGSTPSDTCSGDGYCIASVAIVALGVGFDIGWASFALFTAC